LIVFVAAPISSWASQIPLAAELQDDLDAWAAGTARRAALAYPPIVRVTYRVVGPSTAVAMAPTRRDGRGG
jgi:hypothetical protein